MSELERDFIFQLQAAQLPQFVTEYKFAAALGRQWRFDIAWPFYELAVELEGGVWSGGRHVRGAGFINDCDKYNAAALLGWRVLRFTRKHVDDGSALKIVEDALGV
jgi:hypothetical protein